VLAEMNQVLNFANETILKHRIQRNSSFDRFFPGTDFLGCFRQGLPDGIGIFVPKITSWVHFGAPWNEKCWYFL
jgi:hypothetical protein